MKRSHIFSLFAAGSMLLVWCPRASALNPSLDISQYGHTAWTTRDGFVGGVVALAQTPDGYLWLGGPAGLFRFDGIRALALPLPSERAGYKSGVVALLAARDGTLWICRRSDVVSWKDGKLTQYPTPDGTTLGALAEDSAGQIWSGLSYPARLCVLESGSLRCSASDSNFGPYVTRLFNDSNGNLWAGLTTGMLRWRPGTPEFFPLRPQVNGYIGIGEQQGALLVGVSEGVARLIQGKTELVYPSPSRFGSAPPTSILADRDGGLWFSAYARGVAHVHEGRTDVFSHADGLSGDSISALFEDREGTIWVATASGVDRFRDLAVPGYSGAQGLSSDTIGAVLSDKNNTLWVSTLDGLHRWDPGRLTIYRAGQQSMRAGVREIVAPGFPDRGHALFQDSRGRIWISDRHGVGHLESDRFVPIPRFPTENATMFVLSIAEDRGGDVWICTSAGIVQVRNDRVVRQIPIAALGKRPGPIAADPMSDGLWVGLSLDGGIVQLVDGRVQASYSGAAGLGGSVYDVRIGGDGTVWAATDGGLSRLKNTRIATLGRRNGLPCDSVLWSMEDDSGSVWLYMSCGLVRVPRGDIEAWAADSDAGRPGLNTVRFALFNGADGVRLLPNPQSDATPHVAKAPDGRIWFSMGDSVGLIDPRNLRVNRLAPPVHIEQITADRHTYDATSGLRLPPLVRDLQIDYTALSLVAPEKNRFRVKLEGWDRDWQDVGNRRQAFYNNLPPRGYRFRVVASNNSGVWNDEGATLEFAIAPAYYQTRSFAATVAIGALALLWVGYQLRIRQVSRQFNRTLDARLGERTRIARDLHDTLLQSFQGALLRFQSVVKVLPPGADEARARLDRALDQAEAAITEGRDAVQGLRASATTLNDLANGIAAIGAELMSDPSAGNMPAIDVEIDGQSRDLNSVVRDEAFQIAGEALRNAVKHAVARHVIVTIHYEAQQLRLSIRDDGQGIDADTAARQQRPGHFGLPGMLERATIVSGRLDVRSAPGAGTEIELRVPAAIAYGRSGRSWWSRLFSLLLTM